EHHISAWIKDGLQAFGSVIGLTTEHHLKHATLVLNATHAANAVIKTILTSSNHVLNKSADIFVETQELVQNNYSHHHPLIKLILSREERESKKNNKEAAQHNEDHHVLYFDLIYGSLRETFERMTPKKSCHHVVPLTRLLLQECSEVEEGLVMRSQQRWVSGQLAEGEERSNSPLKRYFIGAPLKHRILQATRTVLERARRKRIRIRLANF
ncbi:unnamed protein product, partial [Amoebophrya sp. A25]